MWWCALSFKVQFNFLHGYRLGSINATSLPTPSTLKKPRGLTLRIAEYQINWISNLQFMKALKVQNTLRKRAYNRQISPIFLVAAFCLVMGYAIFQQCCSHYYTITKTADADSDKPLCISAIILMDFIALWSLWCLYAGDSFLLMYSLLSKKERNR